MNDFIVTIDDEKFNVFTKHSSAKINGKTYHTEISKLSQFTYLIKIDNQIFHITTNKLDNDKYSFLIDGHYFESEVRTKLEEEILNKIGSNSLNDMSKIIKSPMPGLVLRINKGLGESVVEGEPIVLLEAMKMENEIRSPITGTISEILVKPHSSVEKNQTLIIVK